MWKTNLGFPSESVPGKLLSYHEAVKGINEFLTKPDAAKSSGSLSLTRSDFQKYWGPFLAANSDGMKEGSNYFLCPSAFVGKAAIPESRIAFLDLSSFDVFAVLGVWSVSFWMKMGVETIVGGAQVFGDDPSLTDDRNKVHIASPARNNVQVQMASHPRAGAATHIKPDVESIRPVGLLENSLAVSRQSNHLL